jgi:hypothetical protein
MPCRKREQLHIIATTTLVQFVLGRMLLVVDRDDLVFICLVKEIESFLGLSYKAREALVHYGDVDVDSADAGADLRIVIQAILGSFIIKI